ERDLAEEVALVHGVDALVALRHVRLALEQDEELAAAIAFLGHDLSLGKIELVRDVGDLSEPFLRELREEGHLLDQLDLSVLAQTHLATVTAFRPVGYGEEMGFVPAVFGAAAGLAGLLLVFLGVSISAFQSFAGDAPAAATARFRRAG